MTDTPLPPQPVPAAPVPLFALYRVFFWLGLLSFGGGMSAWMHREIAEVRGWMSSEDFISGFALAQMLPGVNSANLAVYIGQYLRGAVGAVVALVGMLTGPFIVVIAVATVYNRLIGLPGFAAATAGVAAVAVGMLMRLGVMLAKRVPRRAVAYAVMLATFTAVGVLQWPLVPVVAVVAPLSIFAAWPRRPRKGPPMRENTLLALVTILAPLSIASIGGASSVYAPLQYQTVDLRHWLTGHEFVDLFAIARVTPGPGTMIATLIGWKVAGLAGALVATAALFLPATVMCFFISRVWNRYRGKPWHEAFEKGLAPIGAGLLFAGVLAILRIGSSGPLAWATAAGVAVLLGWWPRLHPVALLTAGALFFIAVHAVTG